MSTDMFVCRQSCQRCVQASRATQVHAQEFVEKFPYMVSHLCSSFMK